ncbi:MAG: hypothetical protein JNJ48_06420 [Phycisphaerae bacterium]|nr:hypothetical protein [Phycisphaerae bacterium]
MTPAGDKPVLDEAQSAALLRSLVLARKRMFWFNVTFGAMLATGIGVGAAQAGGINARSGGWEATALIAGFVAGCVVMAAGVTGFSIRHVQAWRAVRHLQELMNAGRAPGGGDEG